MWVLIIAFPINVARKNFQNAIPNCPHIIPARSNRGFGTWKRYLINQQNEFFNKEGTLRRIYN